MAHVKKNNQIHPYFTIFHHKNAKSAFLSFVCGVQWRLNTECLRERLDSVGASYGGIRKAPSVLKIGIGNWCTVWRGQPVLMEP